MHLKGSMPVRDIATSLAIQYRMPTSLRVLVTHPYTSINICALNRLSPSMTSDWIDPIPETKTLSQVQWHLSYGDCIILQDEMEPLRALTTEEEESINESQVQATSNNSSTYYYDSFWDDAVPASAPSASTTSSSTSSIVSGPQPPPRVMQRGIVIKTQKAREMEKLKTNSNEAAVGNLLSFDDDVSCSNVGGSNILFGDVD
jgi:hypothetical protein